jgi:hypothetical protein
LVCLVKHCRPIPCAHVVPTDWPYALWVAEIEKRHYDLARLALEVVWTLLDNNILYNPGQPS